MTDEDRAAILEIAKCNTGRVVEDDRGVHWNWRAGYKGRVFRVQATFASRDLNTLIFYEVEEV